MGLKAIFWILVLALIFYVGFKVVPIYYRGIIGIRGACSEAADLYKKYGQAYTFKSLDESLNDIGIPKDKRTQSVEATDTAVVVKIDYSDTADFFGRYTKTFDFHQECTGELKSVY
jgi:hypothetical protein